MVDYQFMICLGIWENSFERGKPRGTGQAVACNTKLIFDERFYYNFKENLNLGKIAATTLPEGE